MIFYAIIIMISTIAIYYTIFVEIFIGAVIGFFLAKMFKTLKKAWIK